MHACCAEWWVRLQYDLLRVIRCGVLLLLLLLLLLQGNAIGSGKRLTSTVNSCGICNGELKDNSHLGEQVGPALPAHCVWGGGCAKRPLV